MNILIIEDNQSIAEQLIDFLTNQSFTVDYAHNGKLGLNLIREHHYDVVILDLTLPDIDGIELCQMIHQQSSRRIPILMLTARDSLSDKIMGFNAGTDDYLTKPFEFEEVAVRCLALSRRHQLHSDTQVQVGDLIIDSQKRTVTRASVNINLSATDYDILIKLAQAYPRALSRNELISSIWGDDCPDSDVLRSHIYTLRKAIDKPFSYAMIKTIHGVGFRLVES
ncbi:response regulator transcription factor [Pleionea sp. CnH1-48]|uniref:response regulator transcription factor n=1 Tax=Pleionea sp. CnH1-48 TaxID=2954494 RepID=UPI0020976956|nr:response regulator transcription factor [Pleionea sp. CnH1-48]MCO7227061.1 response regulator transcription factor [Pleionea sp. CnH1-48]